VVVGHQFIGHRTPGCSADFPWSRLSMAIHPGGPCGMRPTETAFRDAFPVAVDQEHGRALAVDLVVKPQPIVLEPVGGFRI
jgi:hypothetical protein